MSKKVVNFRAVLMISNSNFYYVDDNNPEYGWAMDENGYTDKEQKLRGILREAVDDVNKQYSWIGMKVATDRVLNYQAQPELQDKWTNSFIFKYLPAIGLEATFDDGSAATLIFTENGTLRWSQIDGGRYIESLNTVQPTNVARIRENIIYLHNLPENADAAGVAQCDTLWPWWCNRQRIVWMLATGAAGYFAATSAKKEQQYLIGAAAIYGAYRFQKLGGFGGFFEKLPNTVLNLK